MVTLCIFLSDEDSLAKLSRQSHVPITIEKDKHRSSRKRHRYKGAMKVKIGKKVRNKRIKSLQAKESPLSKDPDIEESLPSLYQNNNKKQIEDSKELDCPVLADEVGTDTVSDSNISDLDIFKDKYDMIKERSLKRAIKVKKNIKEKDKAKDVESSPTKGSDSPKKIPASPVNVQSPERYEQISPTKVETQTVQTSPKQIPQRKTSEKESGEVNLRNSKSTTDIGKGRQRSVSEGLPSKQDAVSKQQALEALLQITGVEFHTMSRTPRSEETLSDSVSTMTSSTPKTPQTSLAGLNKGSVVKISESDKGFVKYQLQSDTLEEQGLKLVYTAHTIASSNQEQINFVPYRSRRSSTRSNTSDSADDPTTKDTQKCCKKLGRHVCHFCGRRCTKPSVLKKHIRSHTGERPYPCLPCGFSFKTKSNLYKHCKTHAHAIKAGLTANSDDLSKLALADLDEDDSEETESEDEITACDATTCQTELTDKSTHSASQMQVGSTPHSEMELITRTSLEDTNTKQVNIPMMQVPRSLATVPNIPRQQADSQSNIDTMSRHSSGLVLTQNSVLPTANIKKEMPPLSALLPNKSSKLSETSSLCHPSLASSSFVAEFPNSNFAQQDNQGSTVGRTDEEVVMSASGASSSQLLKSLLPGELAGFRIDMETRRAIPVLNPQLGTQGASSTTQTSEASSANSGQLLIPITGFNIVKSGGQYHVQIPVQGIPEDSLTMTLDGETGCPNVDDTTSSSSQTKGVSKEFLQERIQLLISQNRAIVDNADLESVKPRRTSTSRRDSENSSPRMDFSIEPTGDRKNIDGRAVTSSIYSDYTTVNSPTRYRRDSVSEAQHQSSVSHSPLADYFLPGEGKLLEKVLKSQQQNPLIQEHQPTKGDTLTQLASNPNDNSNSIKDLLMKDRSHRLAQIAQNSPLHLPVDFHVGQGSTGMKFIQGSSWPLQQSGDSAMSQLRGSLQQHKVEQNQLYPAVLRTAEDVNVSQRISELRGIGHRRKIKSESDAMAGLMPSGPSSPKRRARKIKDIPTAVSPLVSSNVRHHSTNLGSSKTPTELHQGLDFQSATSPHGQHFTSYTRHMTTQPSPLSTSTAHLTTNQGQLTSKPCYSTPYASHLTATTQLISMQSHMKSVASHMTSVSSNMTSGPSHMTSVPSYMTSDPSHMTSDPSHMTSLPSHMTSLPSHMTSVPSHMTSVQSHMTSVPSHMTSVPSHMTSVPSHMTSVPSHMTSVQNSMTSQQGRMTQGHIKHYTSPMTSVSGHLTSHASQLTSHPVFQNTYLGQGPSMFRQSTGSPSPLSSVYTQPSISEVSVIQHTRMQGKSEPTNKELKLEVSQAREEPYTGYSWPYRYPVQSQSPGAASPASQGLHLLAVASKNPNLSPSLSSLTGSRKRSFSMTEGMQMTEKQVEQIPSPWPKEEPVVKSNKGKSTDEAENAAPIAMQLLAAVAHSSSYVPRLSPRVMESRRGQIESEAKSQSLSMPSIQSGSSVLREDIHGNSEGLSKQETHLQPIRASPEINQQRGIGSAEPKKIKMERNTRSPRSPRSEASKQNVTGPPKVPASRRHLTLDLKSPLTSRGRSPVSSESPKPLLQIDPKSLLTPEALSIAESVMKLASPMTSNTPITPVESARELGRLMAHAFHNAGGKVESLITSTQGTMMIGPIATPTPGSGGGSTQYFIIPSPSSSQPPTGFPGPNTLFSPSGTSTASNALVSPLRSPLASSQSQGDPSTSSTSQVPQYKRVPPQKHNSQNKFEKYLLSHVKTNSALKQRIRSPKLSRSTARNPKITQTTFCCVKRPQPMYVQHCGNSKISMYSNWRPGGDFSHPLGISWKAHLGLYDSGRNKKPRYYYVTTSISPPQCGIVTDSAGWRPEAAIKEADSQTLAEVQHQQTMDVFANKSFDAGSSVEKTNLEANSLKAKEKKPKEGSSHHEPSRIQIFAGGYKSNEDYVYVRGRGRGKYVCEECGIRCKKPSMLKKHIRTHTDMRPYQCHICNFAFKTKGNLTKHMKSKAHSKKCIKNGISPTDECCMEHQFSDADDEDTDSADGDTSDEDDEEDDDDISETHSESAVPVNTAVPPRERYSSVPNIQDMHDSADVHGRQLVWHQCHPEDMKKGHSDTQEMSGRDSSGSIPSTISIKSGAASKENPDEKQPVKLSRSEVVGKLSRHLTNRHQQSLEKAQKANISASGKTEDTRDQESSKLFDISQLPLFPGAILPQPSQIPNLLQTPGNINLPPAPPVLDKYGHIVLTKSISSTSQYRLSTTVQEDLSHKSKAGTSNERIMETLSSPPALMQPLASLDKIMAARPFHHPDSSIAASPFSVSSLSTSETLNVQMPNPEKTLNNLSATRVLTAASQTHSNVTQAFSFPSFQATAQGSSTTVPLGTANLVGGVNPMHTMLQSDRQVSMFARHPVSSDLQATAGVNPAAYKSNYGPFHHLHRMGAPPFLCTIQESSKLSEPLSLNTGRQIPIQLPTQTNSQLSPRVYPSAADSYPPPSSVDSAKHIPLPIYVEPISDDDEDEHSTKKRQQVGQEQKPGVLVSGSINNPSSSVPSWMPEAGSAIKQLLLARPSLIPPCHENVKTTFLSPFLPPSLASPKLSNSSSGVSFSNPFPMQPPLVSPMLPSKMMQLPPTILSQVRSPTVQLMPSFPAQEEQRDSPGPFVPPVARSKSQHYWTPHQSHYSFERSTGGEPIPGEAPEELVSSPTQVGNHKCSSCNKIFMKPSQLRIHMRVHLEENSFSCPECVLSFPTRILLAKHERSEEHLSKVDAVQLPSSANETDPRPFKCKECQIAFRIPGHLAKHLRSRGHRMTLEREGKLPLLKDEATGAETMSDIEQGDLIIDDTPNPSSPAGSSDKTDSASESGDMYQMEEISTA